MSLAPLAVELLMSEKKRLTISLDPMDYAALEELATRGERSLSWLIGQAVKSYVKTVNVATDERLLNKPQSRLPL